MSPPKNYTYCLNYTYQIGIIVQCTLISGLLSRGMSPIQCTFISRPINMYRPLNVNDVHVDSILRFITMIFHENFIKPHSNEHTGIYILTKSFELIWSYNMYLL